MPVDWSVLNPFVETSVNEEDLWGEREAPPCDVPRLHAKVSECLMEDLRLVANHHNHKTRVRFVVGAAGAGKSHVFSRLRRASAGRAAFAFAANPPLDAAALPRWTLDKVMQGLRRPWMHEDIPQPYSQLEAILYLVLQGQNAGIPGGSLEQFHYWWVGAPSEERTRQRKIAVDLLHNTWPRALTRVLFSVLEPEQAPLALQWLSGVEGLADTELQALGINEPLNDTQVAELFKLLGPLATLIRKPMLLVLDELGLMTDPKHIAAFTALLTTLIDQSRNWLVAIGLIEDIFDVWRKGLTPPITGRLKAMGSDSLPVVEVGPIRSAADKRALILERLRWPPLADARNGLAIPSPLHPLGEADLDELATEEGATARQVLATASARYMVRTGTPESAQQVPLAEALDARFRDIRAALNPDAIVVDRAEFADRLGEIVELYALSRELGIAAAEKGPLEQNWPRATDRKLRIGERELRVLTHNVQSRGAFPSFLNALGGLPPGTILVRDGAVGIGGQATAKHLREFIQHKVFVHLPRPAMADAYALGAVLAEEREGNFAHLNTEPPPHRENVMRGLAGQDWFTQHPFTAALHEALTRAVGAEAQPPAEPPHEPPARRAGPRRRPTTNAPTGDLVQAVTQEMQAAHWLMLERLRLRLTKRGRPVAMDALRAVLLDQPLCDRVSRHPVDTTHADVQILIWQGDAADA